MIAGVQYCWYYSHCVFCFMATFRNLKFRSYWRSRRDVQCSVAYASCEGHDSPASAHSAAQGAVFVEANSDTNETMEVPDVENRDVDMPEGPENELMSWENDPDFFSGSYDSDCTSVSSQDDLSDSDLGEVLADWVKQYNIPSTAVNGLLSILHRYHPGLPLESRTLLHTSRNATFRSMPGGGTYSHIGITKNLQDIFEANPDDACFSHQHLKIQINVDGLPIFKSSTVQLWPILGILKGMLCEKPFTIGIYCGNQKPCNVHEYFAEFIDEFKQLQHAGLQLGDRQYCVSVHSFVCDAPARSFVKQTKLHSGYSACERCVQKGQWINKVVYPETDAPRRTDISFDELADKSHHNGPSPLQGLGIPLVTLFCLDYMHLVCLGIMRKLLLMWMRGPLRCRISAGMIKQLSENLVRLRVAIPCEFARKPRTLYEIDRWKATEFRQFLLYTGPVVLNGLLTETVYKHFMLLAISIYCCVRSDLCKHYASYARECLIKFVKLASQIYGEDVLVYNMHSVIHIVDDVELFGPLDNISSFPFENYLRCMKKLVRRPSMPLQQLMCRMSEMDTHKSSTQSVPLHSLSKHHDNGPIPDDMTDLLSVMTQYREFSANGCKLKVTLKDGVVLLKSGEIVCIRNILSHKAMAYFVCQRFTTRRPLYSHPFDLSDIDMYVVSELSNRLHTVSWNDIERKCVCMPLQDCQGRYAVIPFAHKE